VFLAAVLSTVGLAGVAGAGVASAASPPTLNLKVLLIGYGASDPTTAAWAAALTSEGVPFDEVTATGGFGSETVTLPTLSSGTTGNYNGVVIADDPADFAAGQLSALYTYESDFGVRQVDGDAFPTPSIGLTMVGNGDPGSSTWTLTTVGLADFPELNGPIPFDSGSYGYWSTVNTGAPYTPILANSAGQVLAGIYQHPATDPQAGVSELALNFNYNSTQLQWLLLAPGLINWVTQDTHLGLYRNYFGMDIDDVFIADNEWSSALQCTPAAMDPPDYTCPPADQGLTEGTGAAPPDEQMTAADADYVAAWEAQTGIKLELAFNAIGACTYPAVGDESAAACGNSVTDPNGTYTDPGQVLDTGYPNDGAFVDELLKDQADFNWITHTWSHQFLGCNAWAPQVLTSATANASGGSLTGGNYSYEITAATAYGESEPSLPQTVTVGAGGSATLSWPEATNGTSTDGTTPGPTLAQLESKFSGGSGFWGYNIYREDSGSTTYGLVGQVAENPSATSSTTYSFTDTGAAAGEAPGSTDSFPTATDPGIDCASGAGSWEPATSASADASIDQEIGMDQAWAAANGLTSYNPAAVVTGEHSGLENPNMTAGLAGAGISVFAQDGSRQPTQYSLGTAQGAPRYPSNIYYNAANWPDELNEYNTLYVAQGVSIGNGEVGHCSDTGSTTCLSAPATEAGVLASESRIMLGHLLSNNPMINYAHQTNLIGPATQNGADYGYTLLDLITNMQDQYNSWYNASSTPFDQVTDTSEAQAMDEQSAWATAETGGNYTASETNGTVTVTNNGAEVKVPITVPAGTTVNGAAFGTPYGGQLSDWVDLGTNATETLTENAPPAFTSVASATSNVGAAFSFTVAATGEPAPSLTESGALPAGLAFTDNGNGTATISGTPATGSGGSYPITITATNASGSVNQSFTLSNTEAPSITSPGTATFSTGVAGSYTVTTTGYPAPSITLAAGTLPDGLTFTPNNDGTATIAGTPTATGTATVSISATNTSGSTATLSLTITVNQGAAPMITSPSTADFTLNSSGSVAVTTTGSPAAKITETGTLPAGLSFVDNGNGTATLAGTPTGLAGSYPITITAGNGLSPDATQSFSIVVGGPPAFTSAASTTLDAGTAGSFTITTSGFPAPSFGWDNVPAGMTFTDNGNGTATLAGTPTTPGSYAMDLAAANSYGSAQQTLTVTVQQAPAITSGSSATFTVGAVGTFTVATTGSPTAAISESGTLPTGVALTDNGNGTATLAGTPAAGQDGSYPITITASNGVSPDATQSFTLTVNKAPTAPAITSPDSTGFTVGTAGTFTVTSTGYPTAALTEAGTLPTGVSFADNGNGTATLAGTPASGQQGSYPITITASNGVSPDATQTFTLTVTPATAAPVITSASGATFAAGTAGTFAVTTTGYPIAAISESGALPSGVALTDNGDGTATLAGTPAAGSQGTYTLTITASSSAGTATQSFVLTVNSAPAFTSAASASATAGQAFSFTVSTSGLPTPALTEAGTLPSGVTFTDNGDGTATLVGTVGASAAGSYPLTFGATNSTGSGSQAFTLTVNNAAAFSSAASTTETAGTAFTFTVTTTGGYPVPTLNATGLPAGVSFSDNGNGTGSLAGTTAVVAGTYPVTLTAANAAGTVTQAFTLTVNPATPLVPTFTSPAAVTETPGQAFTFMFTTVNSPTTYTTNVTESGKLPGGGLIYHNNGNGTATLSGTPPPYTAGVYPITITAKNTAGTVTQAFTLTVASAPVITSGASATATVGSAFSFTAKATGYPAPAMTEAGALPQGLTWKDNANGTATLAGTPVAGQGGVYNLTFTAANAGGTTSQSFTLTVNEAPAITSASSLVVTRGKAFTFTFTTNGFPLASVTHTGNVPNGGVLYLNNHNGTATLSGTPTSTGTYPLTITATNSLGTATQSFVLTVTSGSVAITSAGSASATTGKAFSFTVTATGAPTPTMTEAGVLPQGLTWTDNGNGTAALAGTPTAGQGGVYPLTFTATNAGGTASQSFTLTVNDAPAITNASSLTVPHGKAFTFTFTTTGYPLASVTHTGNVPNGGVVYLNNHNGTATLSGTPTSIGTYVLTITATNSIGTATQTFTLTVT
jgi:Putative Ig domain